MIINCGVCSTEFHAKPFAIKRGRGKFCSRACSDKGRLKPKHGHYTIRVINRGWRKSPTGIVGGVKKICAGCNAEFKVSPVRRTAAKFCSYGCYWKSLNGQKRDPAQYDWLRGRAPWNKGKQLPDLAAQRRGEKNPNWQGGKTYTNHRQRGSRMHKRWSRLVKERDHYTCQLCGTKEGKMQADHIKGFAAYPELRFELSNGRTLCVSCHKRITGFCAP